MIATRPLNKTFHFHFPNCTSVTTTKSKVNEYLNNSDIKFIIHPRIHISLIVYFGYILCRRKGVKKKQLTALGAFSHSFFLLCFIANSFHAILISRVSISSHIFSHEMILKGAPVRTLCVMRNILLKNSCTEASQLRTFDIQKQFSFLSLYEEIIHDE